jgi:hypothetical protein
MPFLPALGAIVGIAGTGISYFSQRSAANTQSVFSNLNAQAGVQQATQNAAVQSLQSQLQATQQQTQQQSAFETAEAQRQQAEMDAKMGIENNRRGRDEFLRALASAQAQQGASGAILATGSPIDVLMNAADTEQQQEQDAQWQINAGRTAGFRQAANTELAGRGAGMNSSLYMLQSLSAVQEGRDRAAQARLEGFAGQATAQGMRNSALGGLFSGVASNLTSFSNSPLNPWGKPKTTYTPKRYG